MKNGNVTLKQIAFIAGLGVSTVSRALQGAPEISASTRARVKQIADSLGYRRNAAAVNLKTGKTNVIAFLHEAQDQCDR